MSTVTPRLGLVKPTTLEQFALSVLNNNMDLLDVACPRISTVNSAANAATWDFTNSKFTRIDFGNGNGIIVAYFSALVKTATALPINTAAGLAVTGVIPQGYQGNGSISYQQAIASGAGRGDEVQVLIQGGSSSWLVRSNTGVAYTTIVGSSINSAVVYQWDGNF